MSEPRRQKTRAAKKKRSSNWGGRREGAGRKPNGDKAGVSHLRRPIPKGRQSLLVTMRFLKGLPSVKQKPLSEVVTSALGVADERFKARVVKYQLEADHLHLVVETDGARGLWRSMQGLSVRIARNLNRELGRQGTVFRDRYDAELLPRPVRIQRDLCKCEKTAKARAAAR